MLLTSETRKSCTLIKIEEKQGFQVKQIFRYQTNQVHVLATVSSHHQADSKNRLANNSGRNM